MPILPINGHQGNRERPPLPFRVPSLLTPDALAYVQDLALRFGPGLRRLLAERAERQAGFDRGRRPGFLPGTERIRRGEWSVAPLPPALLDRQVELAGPPDPETLLDALDSGAQVFMADFEDSLAPTLDNLLHGQQTLFLAIRGRLSGQDPAAGKADGADRKAATFMLRPRGLHLPEPHLEVRVQGQAQPVPACLFDAGLFLFHNAKELLARGSGPFLYLSKLEHHLEARWWNQVLEAVERDLGLPDGCIRTTMLIETLPAAFQMDELLHEQRNRAAGLNLGRWDYLFSFIKTLRMDPSAILPDRGAVDMGQPFLRACAQLLVRTCHRRGCLALGGMSPFVPRNEDPEGTLQAFDQIRADTLREVLEGFDGAWVAHPALVPAALEVFAAHRPGRDPLPLPGPVAEAELLAVPAGPTSGYGLRQDLRVGIRYLESWLRGQGSVVLYGLRENAATVEFCWMQLWQWVNHGVEVAGLGRLERPLFHWHVQDALYQIQAEVGDDAFAGGRFLEAADILETLILQPDPPAFFTPSAYGQMEEAVSC